MKVTLYAFWVTYRTWKCTRHVPSSIIHEAEAVACRMCGYPRPPLDERKYLKPLIAATPDLEPTPVVVPEVVEASEVVGGPHIDPAPAVTTAAGNQSDKCQNPGCLIPPLGKVYCSAGCRHKHYRLRKKAQSGTNLPV